MNFKEMDPEKIHALLNETDEKGVRVHQDLITPLVAKEEALFRHAACPKCGLTSHEAFVDAQRPFIPGAILPNKRLRCVACTTEFDPYSRLITRATLE